MLQRTQSNELYLFYQGYNILMVKKTNSCQIYNNRHEINYGLSWDFARMTKLFVPDTHQSR